MFTPGLYVLVLTYIFCPQTTPSRPRSPSSRCSAARRSVMTTTMIPSPARRNQVLHKVRVEGAYRKSGEQLVCMCRRLSAEARNLLFPLAAPPPVRSRNSNVSNHFSNSGPTCERRRDA